MNFAKDVTSSEIKLRYFSKFLWPTKNIRTLTMSELKTKWLCYLKENHSTCQNMNISGFQTPGSDN